MGRLPVPALVFAAILAALAASACGGDGEFLAAARAALGRGDLAAAEGALASARGAEADRLREEILALREHRAALERRIATLLGDRTLGAEELRERMGALHDGESDPLSRERIDGALRVVETLLAGREAARLEAEPAAPAADAQAEPPAPRPPLEAVLALAEVAAKASIPAQDAAGVSEDPPVEEAEGAEEREPSAGEPAPASPVSSEPPAGPEPAEVTAQVKALLADDDLQGAALVLREARDGAAYGPEREGWAVQVLDLQARMALRQELAAAGKAGDARWRDLRLEQIRAAAEGVELSPLARRGLLYERLRLAWGPPLKLALADLARTWKKGEVSDREAFWHVARARNEDLPAGGYRFDASGWVAVREEGFKASDPVHARLLRSLLGAEERERDAALAALRSEAGDGSAREGLRLRWERSLRVFEGSLTLARLAPLAKRKEALESARRAALDAIRDERTYFYPCDPVEPPHTVEEYREAQAAVDDRLEAVRELWTGAPRAAVPLALRAAAEDLRWTRARCKEVEVECALPSSVPAWILGLPRDAAEIGPGDIGSSAEEAEEIARSRAIQARNEEVWKAAAFAGTEGVAPSDPEQRLMRLVNDYRAMLGLRVLAWDPSLQRMADMHASWMLKQGKLSHEEDDPTRRTGRDRAKLTGYPGVVSEVLLWGRTLPEGALRDWQRSSANHRTLIAGEHTELGAALASATWDLVLGH